MARLITKKAPVPLKQRLLQWPGFSLTWHDIAAVCEMSSSGVAVLWPIALNQSVLSPVSNVETVSVRPSIFPSVR